MKENQVKFISLMRDFTFKTLWILGEQDSKNFLVRLISNLVGKEVREYSLGMNELGKHTYKSIGNKMDILLISKDCLSKINVELNGEYKRIIKNKNDTYIYKLAGEFYSGKSKEKYKDEIDVEQVNLNNYLLQENKGVTISHSVVMDEENHLIRKGVKFHDV